MTVFSRIYRWLDRHLFSLGREFRLSYLPPLMVYLAAGISSLTGIVGVFFVKEYFHLSAEFLAALGFWIMIPWVLKMPLGHLVDLLWRYKTWLVYLGAGLIAASLLIMIGLITKTAQMKEILSVETWYVLSALLAPAGYVIQDVVADAMTVEAVPALDKNQQPYDEKQLKSMHTTMQTLGRMAVIGGAVFVAVLNIYVFSGVQKMPETEKLAAYTFIYKAALVIPVISVLGVILAAVLKEHDLRRLTAKGYTKDEALRLLNPGNTPTRANWWILGGSLVFVAFTLLLGITEVPFSQEIIFIGSTAIVIFLIARLLKQMTAYARKVFAGTAAVIFMFRAIPSFGVGETWWMIDVLKFDQQFLSVLSLIGGILTLFGMFIFRRFMAERSIAFIITVLTLAVALLALPNIGMYYGLHQWTASVTNGVVDAHFIALVDTAAESPLSQIAMIPMLAWIAHSAPANLKATFFAVMAAFANLALALSQLITKYLYKIFSVSREIKDKASGAIKVPEDYSELGMLMITATLIAVSLPLLTVLVVRRLRLVTA